ncbi:NADH-quinone oxidoreductase subunit NuoN [Candidiatus Paracoxiella cheracis]|uniref:NADH-quinone oxidoreductase subunit NuoN n=1 Tax=Candidiatus Paracoxiella cheracis TaxID=3405120 RepID=UPI003BF60BF1
MVDKLPNLIPLIPEMFVVVMALIALLTGAFASKRQHIVYYLSLITLVIAGWLTWHVYAHFDNAQTVSTFGQSFILDRLAVVLKIFIYLSVFLTFVYSRQYNDDRKIPRSEFYVLALLSMVGMMVLVSSHNLLTLFLGVELLALPTYAMVAMQRDKTRCVEAAMKYFVIGALASGMLLYGLSMIFGATKSLDMLTIAKVIAAIPANQHLILIFGLVFIIAGLAFKIGAAPFHMWIPDVYDGAPTSVTLFISTAPKIAGFAMIIRLLVDALPGLHIQWQELLIVIAILSMGIGNFAAIVQTNVKRLLAYSSIAHMGYMLLGILCATQRGYAAAMFYTITYAIMTLGSFGMLILMSKAGFEAEDLKDLAGLGNRNPWLAFLMMLMMFSLAGVPPLVGFIAKVGVLEALIMAHFVWLAVVAVLFAIVGAYYYIRVVKVMFFERLEKIPEPIHYTLDLKIAITINCLAVLAIGIFPGWLFALSHLAF